MKILSFAYLYLGLAIFTEVIGTMLLKASDGMTKLTPTLLMLVSYAIAFYLLSLVFKTIPVGIAYAIWSGLGMVLIVIIAAMTFKQIPDWATVVGITLIVLGVIVIHLFSKMKV